MPVCAKEKASARTQWGQFTVHLGMLRRRVTKPRPRAGCRGKHSLFYCNYSRETHYDRQYRWQIRYIDDRWHEMIVGRDLDRVFPFHAEDAIFETPAILVTLTDPTQGILRGKSELRPFFEAGFRKYPVNS